MAAEQERKTEQARLEHLAKEQVDLAQETIDAWSVPESDPHLRIFNASGHPIIQNGIEVVGEVAVPNVDLADPEAVFRLALDIAKACRQACEQAIPIALPAGKTTLSVFVLSMLQGLTGQLPIIILAARVDGVLVWDRRQTIDLHSMRVTMREER